MAAIRCDSCGLVNTDTAFTCRRCGVRLDLPGPRGGATGANRPTYVAGARSSGRRTLAILAVVAVVVVAIGAMAGYQYVKSTPGREPAALAWQEFEPPGGGYRAMLPGPSKSESAPIMSDPAGSATLYMYTSKVEGQGEAGVGNIDFPIDNNLAIDDAELIRIVGQGFATSKDFRITSSRDVTLAGGYRGAELDLVPDARTGWNVAIARIYWVRPRLYVLTLAARQDSRMWAERETFISSLELRNRPTTASPPKPSRPTGK